MGLTVLPNTFSQFSQKTMILRLSSNYKSTTHHFRSRDLLIQAGIAADEMDVARMNGQSGEILLQQIGDHVPNVSKTHS